MVEWDIMQLEWPILNSSLFCVVTLRLSQQSNGLLRLRGMPLRGSQVMFSHS